MDPGKRTFFLLKDGDARDVWAELLASKIAGCFQIDFVPYEESCFEGIKVSKCGLITSEQRSIVPYEFVEVYCANHNKNSLEFVLRKDGYSYYMMNVIDYLTGNTDRHWGNWGFWVDNRTNRLQGLYPLMDFNKAFLAYDTIEGARCQTTDNVMTQQDAAIEAVKKIGLNQISEIKEEWFTDSAIWEMFFKRLAVLQSIN